MRVVFEEANGWLQEIEHEHEHILGGVVRMRIDREPEQAEAVTFRVGVWLTAVVVNESGPYLVEYGGHVGSDDGTTPQGGTKAARELAMKVESLCDAHGLELRDGKIEAF